MSLHSSQTKYVVVRICVPYNSTFPKRIHVFSPNPTFISCFAGRFCELRAALFENSASHCHDNRSSKCDWAAQVVKAGGTKLLSSESEGVNGGSHQTVEVRRDGTSDQLVQEARSVLGVKTGIDLAVLDGTKVDSEELAIVGVAAEKDGVLEVHGEDLPGDIVVGVWGDAVGPVVRDLLFDEEGGDGVVVGSIPAGAGRHQFVQEAGGSEEEEGQGAEEEVGVLGAGLVVALQAVLGQVLAVVDPAGGVCHHVEQGLVEAEVVTAVGEEVVAGERRVGLELVVAVEAGLAASQRRAEGGASGRITTNAELLGYEIAVGQGETEKGKQSGKIVSDVVDVLLRVNELAEGSDTIASQEAVVCRSV
jgi:hypothetical protein